MQLVFESIRKLAVLKEESVDEKMSDEIAVEANKELLKNAKNIDIKDINVSGLTDKIMVSQVIQKKISDYVTITYYKERERVEKVKKAAKLISNADVGRYTFEYFYDMEEID